MPREKTVTARIYESDRDVVLKEVSRRVKAWEKAFTASKDKNKMPLRPWFADVMRDLVLRGVVGLSSPRPLTDGGKR